MFVWHGNSTPGAGVGRRGTPALLIFWAVDGGRHVLQCQTQFLCSPLWSFLEVYAHGRVGQSLENVYAAVRPG